MRLKYIKSHLEVQNLVATEEVIEYLDEVLPKDYRAIDAVVAYGIYYYKAHKESEACLTQIQRVLDNK